MRAATGEPASSPLPDAIAGTKALAFVRTDPFFAFPLHTFGPPLIRSPTKIGIVAPRPLRFCSPIPAPFHAQ
ncbi:hypothetical protein SRM_02331 [Salinibacter ruber M8]|uniref:Uncharacterized protein n=1 Tax=Salinibacter ruber (strain M8) TaxID=761659 RepID=D5HB47_SALRM|nr:hypothetical protein SRM_02331 [Salinibacter ruber M8]